MCVTSVMKMYCTGTVSVVNNIITQDAPTSESGDNHTVSERDSPLVSRDRSICKDGNIPIAMSVTETSPKIPFISIDSNLGSSGSHAASHDIPPEFNGQIVSNVTPAHISQDKQTQKAQPHRQKLIFYSK